MFQLSAVGHVSELAVDVRAAFLVALDKDFNVMGFGRMTPNLGGLSLIKALRSANIHPVAEQINILGKINFENGLIHQVIGQNSVVIAGNILGEVQEPIPFFAFGRVGLFTWRADRFQ